MSAPEYGKIFIENDETGEVSFQCLCGGMASWWRRVVLTADEAGEYRRGTFDAQRMMVDICRKWPSVAERLVEPIELDALVLPGPVGDS
jgi:hypothetical protein